MPKADVDEDRALAFLDRVTEASRTAQRQMNDDDAFKKRRKKRDDSDDEDDAVDDGKRKALAQSLAESNSRLESKEAIPSCPSGERCAADRIFWVVLSMARQPYFAFNIDVLTNGTPRSLKT